MDTRFGPDRVFLNVPFDHAYEPVLVGLVAALMHLGKQPTTILELGDGGVPRLDRLLVQIQSCAFSIHDLSRVESSGAVEDATPRFNMPFELGLAVAIARLDRRPRPPHNFAILESEPYRLQRSLSDMNGFDPKIHRGTRDGAVRCAFEIFADAGRASMNRASRLASKLMRASDRLKRRHRVSHLFGRVVFDELLTAATHLDERA